MRLMNLGHGMDNMWLNSLLVNHGLDDLMNVVMDVLAGDIFPLMLFHGRGANFSVIFELGMLLCQLRLDLLIVAMLDVPLLRSEILDVMLLLESLLVVHGLNRGVIVVLSDFAVDSSGVQFINDGFDGLVCHGRTNALMNGGCMFAAVVEEFADFSLGLLHDDD